MQAIIDNIENGVLKSKINLVVSDNKNAYALERAKNSRIPIYIINGTNKEDIDIELDNILDHCNVDLIVLAGYLKMIGPRLINKYKIINTHPSLLPKFGGKGMFGMNVHKAVIEAGELISGPTVHFVNEHYDEGNIISQTEVKIEENDTPESLAKKVQDVEKIQLINVLKRFIEEKE